jgi:predicted SPOUT superfamily RNA methylase MTH1
VQRQEIKTYWGFKIVTSSQPFGQFAEERKFDLMLATSRLGIPFAKVKDEVLNRWKNAYQVLVAFGAPTQGLYEILKHENLTLEDVADFVVNMIPSQGTETVRTEEAVFAALSIINLTTTL